MTHIGRLPRRFQLPATEQRDPVPVRNNRVRSRYWRMLLRPLARPTALEPLSPVGSSSDFPLGELHVAKSRFGACTLVRDARTIERSRFSKHVLVSLFVHGGLRGHSGGRPIELRTGDIGFFDLSHPGEFEASSASCMSLLVPRWLLRGQVHGRCCGSLTSPARC
jgi:hypothetical protein